MFLEAIALLNVNELEMGVYMIDLSLENIAYNEIEDKVIFIDIEHVILVDQQQLKLGKIKCKKFTFKLKLNKLGN